MKQETIEKGHGILKKIEDAQNAQQRLAGIPTIELCDGNNYRKGIIRETGVSYLEGAATSPESQEFMQSEFIRFRGRLKRHFAELEIKLKEELEDL